MDAKDQVEQAMVQMFVQSRAQFGSVVKSYWVYDSDSCPGCRKKVDLLRFKGRDAVSLNTFIYRKRGVLIGYRLCARCARAIHRDAKKNPGQETARHMAIELNLINGYHRYMNSLDS